MSGASLWICIVFSVWNLITLLVMGMDKRRARRKQRRIRERTLWLCALCFGAAGAMLGMWLFRHKTRHWRFVVGFSILAAAQILGLIGIIWLIV